MPIAVIGISSTTTHRLGILYGARLARAHRFQLGRVDRSPSRARPHHGDGLFAPAAVGHPHHGDLGDVGMVDEDGLDLDGEDVLAPRDDHLLEPARHAQVAPLVHRHQVPGAQPPAGEIAPAVSSGSSW